MFHNSINALLDDIDKTEGELKRLHIDWQDFKAHKKVACGPYRGP